MSEYRNFDLKIKKKTNSIRRTMTTIQGLIVHPSFINGFIIHPSFMDDENEDEYDQQVWEAPPSEVNDSEDYSKEESDHTFQCGHHCSTSQLRDIAEKSKEYVVLSENQSSLLKGIGNSIFKYLKSNHQELNCFKCDEYGIAKKFRKIM
jgi:hypothetical protein